MKKVGLRKGNSKIRWKSEVTTICRRYTDKKDKRRGKELKMIYRSMPVKYTILKQSAVFVDKLYSSVTNGCESWGISKVDSESF